MIAETHAGYSSLKGKAKMMRERNAFTLIELLVVIAIIALLLAILMPSLQRVRKQAQAVACMSNLRQWSYCWHMYLDDSEGKFPSGAGASGDWPEALRPYYKQRGALTLCPSATKPYTDGGKVPFGAWRWREQGGGWTNFEGKPGEDYGSYGDTESRKGQTAYRCFLTVSSGTPTPITHKIRRLSRALLKMKCT